MKSKVTVLVAALFLASVLASAQIAAANGTELSKIGDVVAQWVACAKRRGIKRIARLTQDFPSINNHVRAVKEEAGRAGITFVYEDTFDATTTDFTSRIAAAKKTSPDVYFIEGFEPGL